jgi:hypothetical protein
MGIQPEAYWVCYATLGSDLHKLILFIIVRTRCVYAHLAMLEYRQKRGISAAFLLIILTVLLVIWHSFLTL